MIDSFVKEKLKASIRIEEVVEHLNLHSQLKLKRIGDYLVGDCITGHHSKSGQCFKLGNGWSQFHCFSCNESYDAIELVQKVKNFGFIEACTYLAENFRQDLLEEIKKGHLLSPEIKKNYQSTQLYEMAFDYGKELLTKEEGSEAFDYLTKIRGYDPVKIFNSEWIYWPPDHQIRTFLRTQLPNHKHHEVNELKLNGAGGDLFRAALPYRDKFGKILGFAKRSTIREGSEASDGKIYRWSYTSGLKKDDLFNIYKCKYQKQLLLVEGLPDAAYLPALGFANIVATGQGELTRKQIDNLKIYEIESIIIAFDHEQKNAKGEIGSLEKAKKASDLLHQNGITSFILPPHLLSPFKDPDEYVQANGIEKFKQLVSEKSQIRERWIPSYFAYKHDLSSDVGRHAALLGLSKEYFKIENLIDRNLFKQSIATLFDLNQNEIESTFERTLKESQEKAQIERHKQAIENVQKLLIQGDTSKAERLLFNLNRTIDNHLVIEPYTVENLKTDLSKIKEGLKTGYPSIDEVIQIPQEAMTIVAGRPSHGKTSTLLNFFVNMVKLYPEREFYFFSYEEPRNQILLKILNILANDLICESNNLANIEGYLRGGFKSRTKIDQAVSLLQTWTETGRLVVCDTPFFVDDLSKLISNLKEKNNNIGAIFIDYIQKIKFKQRAPTRQMELQKISETILETAKHNSVPIILGAQLGRGNNKKEVLRLDNLREAGDIENDAKLVLGIWNEAKEEAENRGESLAKRQIVLDCTILKNRNGPSNQCIPLLFDRSLSTIYEMNWNL